MKLFENINLIMPSHIIRQGYLTVENGKIISISKERPKYNFDEIINGQNQYLSPGFIDIHTHGGGGGFFMTFDEEQYEKAFRMHLSHGSTSILPTTTVKNAKEMKKLVEIKNYIEEKDDVANFIGYFLEGPYTSPSPEVGGFTKGKGSIVNILVEEYESIIKASQGTIKRWMAAPELPGALKFGDYLKANGIIPCIGHSGATFQEVQEAITHGYSTTIHMYSAMSTVTRLNGYRRGGVVESSLLLDELDTEIICDGHHLPVELIQLVIKNKGYDKVMLVSDSGPFAGTKETGDFEMLGHRIIIEDGVCKLPDRSAFASSIACGDDLVRTVYKKCNFPLWGAVRMITKTPARHLGLDGIKGELVIVADADLVVFDEDIRISKVFIKGKEIKV